MIAEFKRFLSEIFKNIHIISLIPNERYLRNFRYIIFEKILNIFSIKIVKTFMFFPSHFGLKQPTSSRYEIPFIRL